MPRKKIQIQGIEYPTLSAAARVYGISVSALNRQLQQDQQPRRNPQGRPQRQVTINGQVYASVTQAMTALGISTRACYRLLKGSTPSEPASATSDL